MSSNPQSYLQEKNPHPRDNDVSFYDPTHTYTVKYKNKDNEIITTDKFTSVTTWIHSHFEPFNADNIISKMMKSTKWKHSKYYGMTPTQIKGLWDKNRDEAASAGTNMHNDIECYYNNVEVNNNSIEYKWFLEFERYRKMKKGYAPKHKPYRTEMIVYDEDLKLVGSIDMLFEGKDGTLQIYDWKRCKEIKRNNIWASATTECINHIPDSNYWHYTLQLNTYKEILERKYDKKVTDLFIVCLHPNNMNKSFRLIRIPIIKDEMEKLFEKRKLEIENT